MKINIKNILKFIINFFIIFSFTIGFLIIKNEIALEIIKLISFMYMVLVIFINIKNIKITPLIFLLIIMTIYQILISFYMKTLSLNAFFSIVSFSILILYFDIQLKNNKDNFRILTNYFNIYFYFTLFIFMLSILKIIPNFYILTGKNGLSLYFLPFIYFNTLNSIHQNNKITYFSNIKNLLVLLIVIFYGGGTSIVSITLAIMSLYIINMNFSPKKLRKVLLILYIVVTIIVLNPIVLNKIPIFKSIIVNVLNKDLTLSGRLNIWNYAIEKILSNFWGYGKYNSIIANKFGIYSITACHSVFLEILLEGGLPLLLLYVLIIWNSLKLKMKVAFNMNKVYTFSYCIFFCLFLNGITESIPFELSIWLVILVINNLNLLFMEEKNEKGAN